MSESWETFKREKKELNSELLSGLGEEEIKILRAVLELEWENRDLQRPRIRKPLRDAIDRIIR